MRRALLCAVIGLSTLCVFLPWRSMASDEKKEKAVRAAGAWLSLVDEERYGESWEAAAAYLKNAVSKEKWQRTMAAFRKPLGKMISRDLLSKTATESLPGAPDGYYVVVRYRTKFEHKESAIETVTPMLESDGKWRVSGYFIK